MCPATWYHAPRGGWTYEWPIPCVVLAEGKRYRIAVLRERDGEVVVRYVTPARIGPALPQGAEIVRRITETVDKRRIHGIHDHQ